MRLEEDREAVASLIDFTQVARVGQVTDQPSEFFIGVDPPTSKTAA